MSADDMAMLTTDIENGSIEINPQGGGTWSGGTYQDVTFTGSDSSTAVGSANLFYNESGSLVGFTDYYDFPSNSWPNWIPGAKEYWNLWGNFECKHPTACGTLNN